MLYFIITSVAILLMIVLKLTSSFTWIKAKRQGVEVSLGQLFMMQIRRVPPDTIVDAMIESHRAELKDITMDQLEAHYLAGGDINNVIHALEYATKSNIDLTYLMATAIDFAGYNVLEAVKLSTKSEIIEIPSVIVISNDGVRLAVQTHVTAHRNIKKIFSQDGEEAIVTSIKKEIVSYIGFNKSSTVLQNEDTISKFLMDKDIDRMTSLKILSIEVSITKY